MLIEKVKDTYAEIMAALQDLNIQDIAVFKNGNDTVIVSILNNEGPTQFIVLTDMAIQVNQFDELAEFLQIEGFGFAYYKPYRDLDIMY